MRELRIRKGLGLRQAARVLGVSHTRLAAFEAGSTKASGKAAIPRRDLLARMAEVYDFPAGTLMALAGYSPEEPGTAEPPGEVAMQAEELAHILYRLSDQERRFLLGTARLLLAEHLDVPPYGADDG
ncbi:MAG: helix-turn-helix transcriptional regulator [Candidatus Sericytochromatia bacterium]|nr:helix-turn-helix transcriptional regulator [Candidatus Tanganyikabacteria bacterium]